MNRNQIDAVELAQQTIWEGLRIYARAPSTSSIEDGPVCAICTGVPYEGFNAATGRRPKQLERIDEVMDLFRRANAPMLWHVWPADREIESALLERGLVFYEQEPAMVADLAVATRSRSPIDMDIRSARDLEDLYAWVRVLSGSSSDPLIHRVAELRGAVDTETAPGSSTCSV